MTFAMYLAIGAVTYVITAGHHMIKDGWGQFKAGRPFWWVWATDIISAILLWPVIVFYEAMGVICEILTPKKTES